MLKQLTSLHASPKSPGLDVGVVLVVDDRLLRLRLRPGYDDVIGGGRPGLEKQDKAQSGQQPYGVAVQRLTLKLMFPFSPDAYTTRHFAVISGPSRMRPTHPMARQPALILDPLEVTYLSFSKAPLPAPTILKHKALLQTTKGHS